MSNELISVTGVIGKEPKHFFTSDGLEITTMRVASNGRKYDRAQQKWVDTATNWYTVTAFRQLAANAARSLAQGERIIVHGRLRVREWTNGEKSGVQVEIEAISLGHDLMWGTTQFERTPSPESNRSEDSGVSGDAFAPTTGEVDWPSAPTADAAPADEADVIAFPDATPEVSPLAG